MLILKFSPFGVTGKGFNKGVEAIRKEKKMRITETQRRTLERGLHRDEVKEKRGMCSEGRQDADCEL